MEEKIKRGMAKWLKKDNLLILLLAGVLLVVIALPTEKSSPGERTDTGLTAGNQESAVHSIDRSTMLMPRRMAYSTVYRVPPAVPSKAAMSREEWSTM